MVLEEARHCGKSGSQHWLMTLVTHSLLEAAGEVISGQTSIGGLVLAAIFTPPTRVVS